MQLKDKVILVTGAGNGIGKELVLTLIQKGAKVAAVDVRADSLEELKNTVKNNLTTHLVDITDKDAVEKLPVEVVSAQGSIDAFINNAGIIQPFVKVNELDYEAIDKVMSINFFGTLYVTKAFLPYLLKRPQGYIVNVSSMGGFLPVPGQSVYGASKAAVKLLTEGLRAELIDTNVGVSVVFPGATQTNIMQNSGVKSPKQTVNTKQRIKMTSPQIAAQTIVRGIESNKPQIFIGRDSKMLNLFYRLSPLSATNLIAKQMKSLLSK